MAEGKLQVYSKPPQQAGQALNLHSLRHELTTPTTGDMYRVGNKSLPGVKVLRQMALQEGITTEILECRKDRDGAMCKVRGYRISDPALKVESIVIELYDDLLRSAVFDAVDNGMMVPTGKRDQYGRLELKKQYPEWEIGPDGFPVLKDRYAQFQLMRNHLNKIKFSERSTMGKAERNVIFKLLGSEEEEPTNDEPVKPTPVEKPNPEQNDLEAYLTRIKVMLLKAHNNNKDLALTTFASLAEGLGVKAKVPVDLKNIEDAKKILDELIRLVQGQRQTITEEDVAEVMGTGPVTDGVGEKF